MSSGIRKLKRSVLKHELGTNDISDAYHQRYGYHTQKTKTEIEIEKAIEKQRRKQAHKKARLNRIKKLFGIGENKH